MTLCQMYVVQFHIIDHLGVSPQYSVGAIARIHTFSLAGML